ncbi:MAG: hypothetical protein AAF628_18190 [Planctomycetota bacterium]
MHSPSRAPSSLLVPILLTLGAVPRAQEPSTAEAVAGAADVASALQAALGAAEHRFVGRVTKQQDEPETMGGGAVVVISRNGLSNDPFTGRIEVVRRGDQTLIASKSELPGVAVFQDGNATIVQTTVGSDPCDATTLAGDLPSLMETERLLREVERADWQFAVAEDQQIVATAEFGGNLLSRRAGGPAGAMLDAMTKKVERIEVEATLARDKSLERIEFRVVRFNPNASLRRRLAEGDLDSGFVSPADLEIGDDEKEEADFERDVYKLEVSQQPASDRSKQLFEQLAIVAKKDGF